MHRKTASTLAAAALLVALPAFADLTIVSRVSARGAAPTTSTAYYTEERSLSGDARTSAMVEYDTGRMILIDHQKKAYFETSAEEIRAQMAQVEAMLKSNPAMSSMFGAVSDIRVETPGDTKVIAGYETQHYVLRMGDTMTFDVWAAPGVKVPLGYHDARKMSTAMLGPMASRFEKIYDEMQKLQGMPLAVKAKVTMMGQDMSTDTEAIEVKEGPIDPAVFAPPAGYKKEKSPLAQ